jgi:hypothetical protein
MKKVAISLKSIAPYTQSRQHHTPKLEKETADAYEERTWREKCTVDAQGFVCIPAIAFKQAFDRAAKMLSLQIPGRGKATYTKHFTAGVMAPENLRLPVRRDDVERIAINANADGVRGSGKRVRRYFPQIPAWAGVLEVYIIDETITREVFERHAREAGMLVGVGQYRPENGGTNGRFLCESFDWQDVA